MFLEVSHGLSVSVWIGSFSTECSILIRLFSDILRAIVIFPSFLSRPRVGLIAWWCDNYLSLRAVSDPRVWLPHPGLHCMPPKSSGEEQTCPSTRDNEMRKEQHCSCNIGSALVTCTRGKHPSNPREVVHSMNASAQMLWTRRPMT